MGDSEGAERNGVDSLSREPMERARRPVPERTSPHRSWHQLYTLGVTADAASRSLPRPPEAPQDPTRVVRDGYRTLEDNLRRGRQAAEELQQAPAGASLPRHADPKALVTSLARAFFDPALTRPLTHLASTWLGVLSLPARGSSEASAPLGPEKIALHPQARKEYRRAASADAPDAPRLLGLSPLRAGEWVGDLMVGGRVRRVQIRELEEL